MITKEYFSLMVAFIFILLANQVNGQSELNKIKIENTAELVSFFKYNPEKAPLICAHRGGATLHFPENCIPTFENTLQKIPVFFEIDPRLTKDSVIIIMHDNGHSQLHLYFFYDNQHLLSGWKAGLR